MRSIYRETRSDVASVLFFGILFALSFFV